MDTSVSPELIVLQMVRGQKDWTVLQSLGLNITFDEDGMCQVEGKRSVIVSPTVSDIARGFTRLQSDPSTLKQCASVILTASSVIDLEKIEDDPSGDILIDALWDTAYGQSIAEEAKNVIEVHTEKK